MKLPIEQVKRMAAPLMSNFYDQRKESWVKFEILPEIFFYRMVLNGNMMAVTRARFFSKLEFLGRHQDTVEFRKYNGDRIYCEISI